MRCHFAWLATYSPMKNQPKKNSGTPFIIIGGVLIALIAGGYYFYSASKTTTSSNTVRTNTNQARSNQQQQQSANAPPGAQPPNMLGSPTAAVTVEEFADFQCPACAAAHPAFKEIQQIYGSRIKFIFRNFPLHDKSLDAAVATEAAGMQGSDKFWAMHNQLFTNQKSWSVSTDFRSVLLDYARKIGLDVAKFEADMAGEHARNRVNQDRERGRGLGVSSTPSAYINGQAVPYPEMNAASMRQLIDAELQRSAAQRTAAPAGNANASSPANAAGK